MSELKEANMRYKRARKELKVAKNKLKGQVKQAREEGQTLRAIAEMVDVSNVTILNWSREEEG